MSDVHKAAQTLGHQGGIAPHPQGRGLQNADQETREKVASAGGSAYHEKRGAGGTDNPQNQAASTQAKHERGTKKS